MSVCLCVRLWGGRPRRCGTIWDDANNWMRTGGGTRRGGVGSHDDRNSRDYDAEHVGKFWQARFFRNCEVD